ncbi:eukaryotic mitochondrial regulator protein [Glomus cerebriforme]|uniref:Eukaryotic mitochondrial regulator protein n=1 Tax=Glomus cerebriforme TaxID=658196 RepID=A0A397TJ70_9GLOM|nr:eukaryotic mitochondrial regulator protein [Glomus cerebriforme]
MRIISNTLIKQVSTSTFAYTIPYPSFYSYKRTYYSTPILFDKNETTPLPKEEAVDTAQSKASSEEAPGGFTLNPGRARRPKYKLWLLNEGNKFANFYDRPNYLDANIPFPMNPFFKPQPPLNDHAKEEIWVKFTEAEQTPRKIGTDYGISLKRVEAILKLKKMEKDMVKKGITLQVDLRERIEKMLGARSFRAEPLTDTLPNVGKPNFEIIDENQNFSPKDAAKILRRPALSKIQEKESKEELLNPFSLKDNSEKDKQIMTLVGRDKNETNQRFRFKFKAKGKEQNTILRDRDGSLYEIKKELIR